MTDKNCTVSLTTHILKRINKWNPYKGLNGLVGNVDYESIQIISDCNTSEPKQSRSTKIQFWHHDKCSCYISFTQVAQLTCIS